MDAIRLSLLVETARAQALADERDALDADIERESAIAAINWQIGVHPYGQRVRARRAGLESDHRAVEGRLHRLRDAAMEACGQMVAITEAVAGFAGDRTRREDAAEQARADDLNGSRRASRHGARYREATMTAGMAL